MGGRGTGDEAESESTKITSAISVKLAQRADAKNASIRTYEHAKNVPRKYKAGSGPPEALVGSGGDDVAVGERVIRLSCGD